MCFTTLIKYFGNLISLVISYFIGPPNVGIRLLEFKKLRISSIAL